MATQDMAVVMDITSGTFSNTSNHNEVALLFTLPRMLRAQGLLQNILES